MIKAWETWMGPVRMMILYGAALILIGFLLLEHFYISTFLCFTGGLLAGAGTARWEYRDG